jgi:hypothetical protein
VVENESLIVICQAANVVERVMHTVVFDRLIGLDLWITIIEARHSGIKIKKGLTTTE